MTFAKAMFGFSHWYRSEIVQNEAFPLKITLEAGNADIAAQMLLSLSQELAMLQLAQPDTPLVELDRPFRFLGFIVEIKLRPSAPRPFITGSQELDGMFVRKLQAKDGY